MKYNDQSDSQLAELVSQGDEAALSEIYDRYADLVFSIALNSTGNQQSAEEVTQDVFLQLWKKAASYDPQRAKLSTWLASIARYRAIDLLRRQDVRPAGHSVGWEAVTPEQRQSSDNPEGSAVLQSEQERVRAALADIPEEQSEVIALAFFLGQTHEEISENLNIPLGTIKTRIRLGMQKLRKSLVGDEN